MSYHFRPEEMDKIEEIITRHPDGASAAFKFFAEQRPSRGQLTFIQFLGYAITNAITILEEPITALNDSGDYGEIPIRRSGDAVASL